MDEKERAVSLAMLGLVLLLAGGTLAILAVIGYSSYSASHKCLEADGSGGSSSWTGSGGGLTADQGFAPVPEPRLGRCSGRVNDVYVEGAIGPDFYRKIEAAKDAAYRNEARLKLVSGAIVGLFGVSVLGRGLRRFNSPPPLHPSQEL